MDASEEGQELACATSRGTTALSPPRESVPEQRCKDWGQGFFMNLYNFGGCTPLLFSGAYVPYAYCSGLQQYLLI